ncbi:hypothetical protein CONPUDRAFT_157646 [Coniophora puteana RWD-64-598 SS2]|uniref:Uncharacterized protein n=1 Tax=Coniophora puteana (strain RWD-64-598) TaxID=741705 RepID=A0A5M3MFK1_CONPW|nr:uncharacterized protein CONPUDRAFT_157646 [Coniophora puteana RWD-64-598 SS2]EIW77395.1 hypothetical protein CONPUDRAFT_157646 [Coniophora puteana RWD-64-598 SS2]
MSTGEEEDLSERGCRRWTAHRNPDEGETTGSMREGALARPTTFLQRVPSPWQSSF